MRRLFLLAVFWGPIPIFFIDPFYGIVHYALINIIRPEQLLWGGDVGRIFYADQVACFLSWLVNKEKLSPGDTPTPLQVKLLWLVALEMTIVTFGFAFYQDWSWQWTWGFIKLTVLCFVMSKAINTGQKLERYYAVSLVWFSLLAIWGIQQKLYGNVRMEGIGGRVLPEINTLTAVYVLYFPMAYYSLFSRKKWIKFFVGIPSFIIFVIFIMFGGSRGGFLGMIICISWIFLRTKGTQKFKMLLTWGIIGGILIAVLSVVAPEGFFDEYTERLNTIFGEEDEFTGEVEHESSSASRLSMWKGALFIYFTHPEYWLFGVGMNCYRLMYYEYHRDELYGYLDEVEFSHVLYHGSGKRDLHNTYLSLLMGGGILVFLSWMFLVFYVWLQAHNIPKKYPQIVDGVDIHNYARAIEIGIVGYCMCIMFATMEFIDFFYWHLTMAGIITNLGKAKLKREELGIEDEEFIEEPVRVPGHASYPY